MTDPECVEIAIEQAAVLFRRGWSGEAVRQRASGGTDGHGRHLSAEQLNHVVREGRRRAAQVTA